jgi:hypothetical protein
MDYTELPKSELTEREVVFRKSFTQNMRKTFSINWLLDNFVLRYLFLARAIVQRYGELYEQCNLN